MNHKQAFSATKIFEGKDALEQLCQECLLFGNKALIIFSENNIKQIGLYARVISLLNICGIEHVTFEYLNKNIEREHIAAIKLAKQHQVNFIVTIGNDCSYLYSKIIAHKFESTKTNGSLPIIRIAYGTQNLGRDNQKEINSNAILSRFKPSSLFKNFEF